MGTPYNPEEDQDEDDQEEVQEEDDQEEDEEEDTQEEVQPDVAPDPLADEMGGLNIGNDPVGDENPPVIGEYIPQQNLRVGTDTEINLRRARAIEATRIQKRRRQQQRRVLGRV